MICTSVCKCLIYIATSIVTCNYPCLIQRIIIASTNTIKVHTYCENYIKMSQHWHGHWTEDAFAPKRLRNWEVPKWYPSWPDKHCVTTKFIADDNGRILDNAKKVGYSPWGTFKGTWDLPKKITRSIAKELSISSQYKRNSWEMHKKKHHNLCKKIKHANKDRKKEVIKS